MYRRAFPPLPIFCKPSLKPGITRPRLNSAGAPPCLSVLSKTVPSTSLPVYFTTTLEFSEGSFESPLAMISIASPVGDISMPSFFSSSFQNSAASAFARSAAFAAFASARARRNSKAFCPFCITSSGSLLVSFTTFIPSTNALNSSGVNSSSSSPLRSNIIIPNVFM